MNANDLRYVADSDFGWGTVARRSRLRAAADLMDQGWELRPPSQSETAISDLTTASIVRYCEHILSQAERWEYPGRPGAVVASTVLEILREATPLQPVTDHDC